MWDRPFALPYMQECGTMSWLIHMQYVKENPSHLYTCIKLQSVMVNEEKLLWNSTCRYISIGYYSTCIVWLFWYIFRDINECEETERTTYGINDYRCENDPDFEGNVSTPFCINTVGNYWWVQLGAAAGECNITVVEKQPSLVMMVLLKKSDMDKDKDFFIGPQEFVVGYSKAPGQPQNSARPICHSHAMTRTGREPATIRIAA